MQRLSGQRALMIAVAEEHCDYCEKHTVLSRSADGKIERVCIDHIDRWRAKDAQIAIDRIILNVQNGYLPSFCRR